MGHFLQSGALGGQAMGLPLPATIWQTRDLLDRSTRGKGEAGIALVHGDTPVGNIRGANGETVVDLWHRTAVDLWIG